MQISNQTNVRAPLPTLWDILNDVERVAPYVPGFELQEAEGDTYRGTVKVKVGAVTVSYNAEIEVLERDVENRRVVMAVSGRERRGPGSMNANVTSDLTPQGEDSTDIALTTDLKVTGRVAQFGGSVLSDVASSLLNQFVRELEKGVLSADGAGTAAGDGTDGASPTARADTPPADNNVLDITAVAGGTLVKRVAPVAIGAALVAIVAYLLGRRR
jgi:carbon monoxide dehydrogenase subunit G